LRGMEPKASDGLRYSAIAEGLKRVASARRHADFDSYFGDNVTGTSVILSTGSALSAAALRTAASLGPS
jgi:hypothetical protein